jgi:hypothetical protein
LKIQPLVRMCGMSAIRTLLARTRAVHILVVASGWDQRLHPVLEARLAPVMMHQADGKVGNRSCGLLPTHRRQRGRQCRLQWLAAGVGISLAVLDGATMAGAGWTARRGYPRGY